MVKLLLLFLQQLQSMCNKEVDRGGRVPQKTRKLGKIMTKKSMRTTHIYTSTDAGSYTNYAVITNKIVN